MRMLMVCPAPAGSRKGNRVTALRWAAMLRELGHRLTIRQDDDGSAYDFLVALHARKSADAIRAFRQRYMGRPVILALTGTDLYRDIRTSRRAKQSLEIADRIVVLQPRAIDELAKRLHKKVRVIYQSARPVVRRPTKKSDVFEVCVLGHLRHEKDPLRAALALRMLPTDSMVRVVHAGEALGPGWAERAETAMARDRRYRWLGEIPRARARRLLARSRLLVLSSRMEGGANVISEAVVNGVAVLASRISGTVGLLGSGYPGYYPVGDTRALAGLLRRAETDSTYYGLLARECARRAALFNPARELAAWKGLVRELTEPPHSQPLSAETGERRIERLR